MLQEIIIVTSVFFSYSLLHSLFSGLRIKAFFQKYFPKYYSFYRAAFNVIQLILFIFMWIFIPKPGQVIYQLEGWPMWFFRIFQILSLAGLASAITKFRKSEFLGLAQIQRFWERQQPEKSDEKYELTIAGPYAASRHPIYLFTITLFLFEPEMTLFKMLFVFWLIFYFYIGSYYEERRLVREFGERYTSYQKNVSRIFPFKWLIGLVKL